MSEPLATMIERVRLAWRAAEAAGADPARAAIAAMREPTNAMRKVCSFETAEIEYPAMIDAALAEKP